ncbi:MAG: polyphosphate kinase 1 [Anaeroplasmataceae bacterium]
MHLPFTQNRELSWLKFNERVLEEAGNKYTPLMERLKFLEIFTSNLDEFYMVRVGSLYNLDAIDPNQIDLKSDMKPLEQINNILAETKRLVNKKMDIYKDLIFDLNSYGVNIKDYKELSEDEKKYLKYVFKNEILPILSPSIIDASHPFPFLENKSLYLTVELKKKDNDLIGIVELPKKIPGFFITEEDNIIFFENIILEFADIIFKHYKLISKNIIRITRNADITLDEMNYDEELDLKDAMMDLLKKRNRLKAVRLEARYDLSKKVEGFLLKKLSIPHENLFISDNPLDFKFVYSLMKNYPSKYFYPKFNHKHLFINENEKIIPQILNEDSILFYPFESVEPFLKLIKEAALDKNTISISITIYRLSERSKLVDYLIMAAENGISVTCLVELRARFDEKNNIDYALNLEDAGCRVIYGFDNFKVHSKICLIKSKNKNKTVYITQIGSGNYNEKTVNIYTDYSYITSRNEIGLDAAKFFQNMLLGNLIDEYKYLLVSPNGLKNKLIAMIDEEANKKSDGYIFLKVNSITDIDIIKHLSLASNNGCIVKMIVRGICCILPGVLGYTENIEIHSIVGRFLEHSRIYQFSKGDNAKVYISSADMMTRNTTRRVEVAVPILSNKIKRHIINQIDVMLKDNINGRMLDSNGNYNQFNGDEKIDSHQKFIDYNIKPKEVKVTFKSELISALKENHIEYSLKPYIEYEGQKRFFDIKIRDNYLCIIETSFKITSRKIEKWFFLSNQLKSINAKLIVAFNCDKDINLVNQLKRIGVKAVFKNTISEYIESLDKNN